MPLKVASEPAGFVTLQWRTVVAMVPAIGVAVSAAIVALLVVRARVERSRKAKESRQGEVAVLMEIEPTVELRTVSYPTYSLSGK
jgi:uncharacterized membrane protein YciS (DUF1049 family)